MTVQNGSTENLPRHSRYQGYRDLKRRERDPTAEDLKSCYIQIIKVQCHAVIEMYKGPGQLQGQSDKVYAEGSGGALQRQCLLYWAGRRGNAELF